VHHSRGDLAACSCSRKYITRVIERFLAQLGEQPGPKRNAHAASKKNSSFHRLKLLR
jgi:hypothetical protein